MPEALVSGIAFLARAQHGKLPNTRKKVGANPLSYPPKNNMAQDKTKKLSEEELQQTTGGTTTGGGQNGGGQGSGYGNQPDNWMFGNVFENAANGSSGEGGDNETGSIGSSSSSDASTGGQSM